MQRFDAFNKKSYFLVGHRGFHAKEKMLNTYKLAYVGFGLSAHDRKQQKKHYICRKNKVVWALARTSGLRNGPTHLFSKGAYRDYRPLVEGHPRSLMLVPIETSKVQLYATSYFVIVSSVPPCRLAPFQRYCRFLRSNLGMFPIGPHRPC